MLAPAPGSLQIDATLGGGGHTERILEATDPDGRLLGLDADGAAIARVDGRLRPRFGDRLVLRQANFRELATVAPRRRASAPSTARCSTSGCRATSWPTPSAASASGPAARSTCASTPRRGVPAAELLATLDADELTALFRRYGEEPQGRPDRPGDRRRSQHRADRDRRGAGRARRARRPAEPAPAATDPPGDARLPGAADRGQRGARRARRTASPPRSTCCGPAAGSSSSATTPSRTASSSASSPPSGGAASARPSSRSASAAGTPRLRLVTRPSLTPTAGRDRRQPTRPERPPAGRRAARRLTAPAPRTRKEEPP